MRPEELKQMPLPQGMTVAQLEGACPGKPGRARLHYGTDADLANATVTDWVQVGPETDFTHQFHLDKLQPDTVYYYAVEMAARAGNARRRGTIGRFRTAPKSDQWRNVRFITSSNQDYICHDIPEGYRAYRAMKEWGPDFLVANGDSVYYDTEPPLVTTLELARYHWQRMFSLPTLVDFFHSTSGYWQKDDHDSFEDDDWSTRKAGRVAPLTYQELTPIFREQVPVGPVPYRKFRWGKGLEIWIMESRDFRSPNPDPDGPNKTLWGREQKEWMKRTVLASDAVFRVLISPTPVVGPDQPGRDYFRWPGGNGDNHVNASFGTEGREIREWVRDQKLKDFYEICGDRHWQYHSVDPATRMHEFSCGAVSDTHTVEPFPADPRYHRFLRFKGGFLSVSLEGPPETPSLAFRFHDVAGNVVYEYLARGQSK
jgi:alkaline phosphatase D